MSRQFCVVTGNPIDGLFITGPFESQDEAVEWATHEQQDQEWWITALQSPEWVQPERAEWSEEEVRAMCQEMGLELGEDEAEVPEDEE